jgi:hypothetical protein
MKKYLFFIIVLYSACEPGRQHKASKTDCDKFKKGDFLHKSQGDPTVYRIQRTDSVQKEIIGKTGDFVNLKISWTGPCTYELTFLDQHISGSDSVSESLKKTMLVKVEILEIRNDTCFVMAEAGDRRLPGIVYIDKK